MESERARNAERRFIVDDDREKSINLYLRIELGKALN